MTNYPNAKQVKQDSDMTMAEGESGKTSYLMARVLRNPHLWILSFMLVLMVIIHYHETFTDVWLLDQIGSIMGFGLTRQTLWRILFLIPVIYASATLGTGAGLSVVALILAAMLPRDFLISTQRREALFETGAIILVSVLMVWLFDVLLRKRQWLADLEEARSVLNLQIKRLSMLHVISGIVSQSLEPAQVVAAIDKMKQLMGIDAAWLYLWDEGKRYLRLAGATGLPEAALPETLSPGQGLDGAAVQWTQPIIVADLPNDSVLRPMLLKYRGLQSALVIPLKYKDEVLGTLGIGSSSVCYFTPDEVDLLRAIGDHISMAVENARLYEKECSAAEALRVSEKNYRQLFENASDAIWVHDLKGTIMASNSAFERLIGYDHDDLIGAHISMFLKSQGRVDQEVHEKVLRGESAEHFELELIKKDGGVITVQMGTNLITKGGQPWAFQHIARDITEEKSAQANLKLYVQLASQAQEAERKRIARELHDETAQALVTVLRNLDDLASGHSRISIKDIREQVTSVLRGVRHFSQQLRPSILDDLGLLPAVKWLAAELTKNHGIAADVKVLGEPHQLPPDTELMLFRIAQEALSNVQRHSEAKRVCITMEFSDHNAKMTVRDNGKGFEMAGRVGDLARSGKLGLAGIQERAQLLGGMLTIDTAPGKGTTLAIDIPLQ